MYYEINVSLNGKHFFATHERSITTEDRAIKIYNVFKEKFPETEGYRIEVTKWDKIGKFLDFE